MNELQQRTTLPSSIVAGESPHYSDDIVAEFWKFVDQTNGPEQCWEWMGPRHRQGHGTFTVPGIWSSPPAHRIAYHIAYGRPPAGHVIWRECSQPLCVNPAHLKAGSRSAFAAHVQSSKKARLEAE